MIHLPRLSGLLDDIAFLQVVMGLKAGEKINFHLGAGKPVTVFYREFDFNSPFFSLRAFCFQASDINWEMEAGDVHFQQSHLLHVGSIKTLTLYFTKASWNLLMILIDEWGSWNPSGSENFSIIKHNLSESTQWQWNVRYWDFTKEREAGLHSVSYNMILKYECTYRLHSFLKVFCWSLCMGEKQLWQWYQFWLWIDFFFFNPKSVYGKKLLRTRK